MIAKIISNPDEAAFRVRRRDFYADGTWLKHAQLTPLYIRLFRPNCISYERLVNPVTVVIGAVADLEGYLDHYPFSKGIGFWFQRHVQYADFEAKMVLQNSAGSVSLMQALFCRDFEERRRQQKRVFYALPFRPFIKFCYMLLWRRAFLDGRAGVTYAILQWIYEYLIVLKARELEAGLATQRRVIPDNAGSASERAAIAQRPDTSVSTRA
jgi:hypothetical protein